MTVVSMNEFRKEAPPETPIWTCECGSGTWCIHADNSLKCSDCGFWFPGIITAAPSVTEIVRRAISKELQIDPSEAKVEHLKDVKDLFLAGVDLADLEVLKQLPNLTMLSLANTPIEDLSILSDLTQLEHLNLTNTNVSDLSPIYGLRKLKSIQVTGTEVPQEDVWVLKQCLRGVEVIL